MEFPIIIDGKKLYSLRELKDMAETNGKAQVFLGEAFFNGDDVPQDYRKAFSYFTKAVEKGESQGMMDLAYMYRKGFAGEVDLLKTERYYLKAYHCGDEEALGALAEMYVFGMGPVKQDLKKGMEYAYKAIFSETMPNKEVCSWFGGEDDFLMMYQMITSGALDDNTMHMICQKFREDQSPEYKIYEPDGLYD